MKIAITGHTRGLGRACARIFEQNNIIVGLSRSNGFDINDIQKIADAAESADVFINNAYCGYQQSYLLEEMFKRWSDVNKCIVNIGSACTIYPRIEQHLDLQPWPYRDHKKSLETMFRHLTRQRAECKLQLIVPGAIDTQMIEHLDCKKIPPMDVAEIIKRNLGSKVSEIVIHE